ncbi:FMRFamide receptor-like [Physella acuta]|uniref:FMRFamide receptor-like n=1 Tax=Physella acuta TaxID=109671 RepID=UPI0027DAEA8F|nr:FMRFamide receptor-like [Physella acuta]
MLAVSYNTSLTHVTHTTQVTQVTQAHTVDGLLLSDEALRLFNLINYVILGGCVSVVGVVLNLVNVAVYTRLGYRDTSNMTLSALSLSDTGLLLMMLAYSLVYNPLLPADNPELIYAVRNLGIGWPHVIISRVSGCIKAFIALERFIAIAHPLKVKAILTQSRTLIVCFLLFAVPFAGSTPVFVCLSITSHFNSALNMSTLALVACSNRYQLESVAIYFNMFLQLSSFLLISVLTVGLVHAVLKTSRWRKTSVTSGRSTRDQRLTRTVLVVCLSHIACVTPNIVGTVVMLIYRDNLTSLRYKNLLDAIFSSLFLLGAVNSSINIFIYIKTSSKFFKVLKSFVCRQTDKKYLTETTGDIKQSATFF